MTSLFSWPPNTPEAVSQELNLKFPDDPDFSVRERKSSRVILNVFKDPAAGPRAWAEETLENVLRHFGDSSPAVAAQSGAGSTGKCLQGFNVLNKIQMFVFSGFIIYFLLRDGTKVLCLHISKFLQVKIGRISN